MGMASGFFGQASTLVAEHREDLRHLAQVGVSQGGGRRPARSRAGRLLVKAGVRLGGPEVLSLSLHRAAG